MIHSSIQFGLENRVLHLHFHDSSTRNSLSLSAADEMRKAWLAHQGKFDFLVLQASGRVFCSGGNLSDYASMKEAEQGKAVNRQITSILDELSRLPAVTIAQVEGDCFGGGVELISCFDFVFSTPQAFFALWQRKIGLVFGWGGGVRIEQRMGAQALRQWALSTEAMDSHQALGLGLIDRVFLPAVISEGVSKFIALQRALPQGPVSALKRWLSSQEREIFESLWMNDEHRKVLAKYKP